MNTEPDTLIGPYLDKAKNAWQQFSAQPGNTHIAVAAALLLGLVLMVTLVDGDAANDQQREPVAAARDAGSANGSTIESALESITGNTTETATTPVAAPDAPAPVTAPADAPVLADVTGTGVETTAGVNATALPTHRLVIILDDIGYNAEAGERAVGLPGAVTYAVLPFTPHGQALAQMAHDAGKEVMLHAPMSNLAGMALGEGGLTLTLTEAEFIRTLRAAIADIPHVAGVNNHTGSELTAAEQPMQWVMRELKAQDLFFVDSMTTGKSVAAKVAIDNQVPALKRHVFLDNEATAEAIDREFQRAVAIAQQQGFAVAIGHPYPATLEYLEQAIDTLPAHNITLVPASALLTQP
ncbi:divergent polysaccharide deacetylase family protein [Pseudohongiella sp.]|uniref:Divergent polysaccharide deacetylase family protein n=1 Tax=marine sediment metagenome TaxID=412755 RepID=A0A0F9YIP9_9ZZZZ|nr:divergent polysaccharide deacetylase family protein [Pseudohongiella sp.]HDZ09327.1 divergent polysaccharide deacetylase family protein [Pseudohongiella sp.]HEA63824.1 divergent polysaccharide deacetylase family protein [Pseudohongiella sp.]